MLAGLDEAARKQVQRTLDELALDGQVLTFQPQMSKTLGVRLSEAGDQRARAMVGLPTLDDAISVLRYVADLERQDNASSFLGRRWVPETALAGVRWGDHERLHLLVELEENLLPALVRSWAESNCSVHGHAWYVLTETGRTQLDGADSSPMDKLPIANNDARREYYGRLKNELLALTAARPDCEREIGEIPMPLCAAPTKKAAIAT